jgi:hypothetical protein
MERVGAFLTSCVGDRVASSVNGKKSQGNSLDSIVLLSPIEVIYINPPKGGLVKNGLRYDTLETLTSKQKTSLKLHFLKYFFSTKSIASTIPSVSDK